MSPPVYTCHGCGAQLSLDHLRGTDCPYCRAAFPHHGRAHARSLEFERARPNKESKAAWTMLEQGQAATVARLAAGCPTAARFEGPKRLF